jgi:hypothetical protein
MVYAPLAIKRRFILGDIYNQCNTVGSIPVYMNNKSEEPLGYADESLGHYADAFLFHLPELICKKLSSGHYDYVLHFDYSDKTVPISKKSRIKLNCIMLVSKKISA